MVVEDLNIEFLLSEPKYSLSVAHQTWTVAGKLTYLQLSFLPSFSSLKRQEKTFSLMAGQAVERKQTSETFKLFLC